MASDPEELLAALDDAEVIGIVTDAMGDWVKVGVLRTAVLIGVNGSPAILDTPERRDEFARYYMEACRQADAAAPGQAALCPGGCCCRLGTEDADARECGCDGGCCGEDDAEAAPFDNGMHFTESLCPSSLGLIGGGSQPCHLEVHHGGPHSDIDGHVQWVGTGNTARTIEPSRSPLIAGNRMRAALGYDRQAHLAWYETAHPGRPEFPDEPRNEAAALAAIADYTNGQVTP